MKEYNLDSTGKVIGLSEPTKLAQINRSHNRLFVVAILHEAFCGSVHSNATNILKRICTALVLVKTCAIEVGKQTSRSLYLLYSRSNAPRVPLRSLMSVSIKTIHSPNQLYSGFSVSSTTHLFFICNQFT